jgi:heterotetrameric sarcosine oxidase gamma subunit
VDSRTGQPATWPGESSSLLLEGAKLRLRELRPLGRTIIRLGRSAERYRVELATAAGVPLPDSPGNVPEHLPVALWRSPLDWLILTEPGHRPGTAARLREALGNSTGLVADVSDTASGIELWGEAASALLAKGCALDTSAWPEHGGFCVPAACARVPVLVHRPGPGRFWLHVDHSLAHYLRAWLGNAATEFDDSSSQ